MHQILPNPALCAQSDSPRDRRAPCATAEIDARGGEGNCEIRNFSIISIVVDSTRFLHASGARWHSPQSPSSTCSRWRAAEAARAEDKFRRKIAEQLTLVQRERSFAFRRLNLMRAVAGQRGGLRGGYDTRSRCCPINLAGASSSTHAAFDGRVVADNERKIELCNEVAVGEGAEQALQLASQDF
jgi:hypothetical protein